MLRIIVAGYMVRFPLGGQVWSHLQYLLGLKQLRHTVFFFEDFGWNDSCYDPRGNRMTDDAGYGVQALAETMRRFGMEGKWVYRDAAGRSHGMTAHEWGSVVRDADLLINLSGVTWFEGFEDVPHRVFIDEDPAFTQVRAESDGDFRRLLECHHTLYTYGHNVGRSGCTVPTAGLEWSPFCQPIVLDEWAARIDERASTFTTLMSWNAYGPTAWGGAFLGQKSHEFPRVIDLPGRTRQRLELAVSGADVPVSELQAHGWNIEDPVRESLTIDRYRDYIRRSRGELSVAKQAYVATRSGWFSDRSACYLASARPVILQDTGYATWLPAGEGLVAFRDLEQAVGALELVNGDYVRHCRAARAIAEEFFDARRVLGELLARA